mgnify:CR=1 FL=1|jgi:hypothetical protein
MMPLAPPFEEASLITAVLFLSYHPTAVVLLPRFWREKNDVEDAPGRMYLDELLADPSCVLDKTVSRPSMILLLSFNFD